MMTDLQHNFSTEKDSVCDCLKIAVIELKRIRSMALNKLDTTMFDDLTNQVSIKVLSSHHELYAIWKEKDEVVMQIHYCKKSQKLNLLDGSLGLAIDCSSLTEEQKICRCSDALEKAIRTQKSLARIKIHQALINRNNQFMQTNHSLMMRSKLF